jgi:hypothetical protein
MFYGAVEVFGIEWVGDRPLLVQLGPLIGSLFVALVAAYAARLAAKTANDRQREQLEHSVNRQREQLAHDSERQAEELEHDREMRKQEHARGALDSAIELVSEAQDSVAGVIGNAEWVESQRSEYQATLEDDEVAEEEKSELLESMSQEGAGLRGEVLAAKSKVLEMYGAAVRLKLRLGYGHVIGTTYEKLMYAWIGLLDALDVASGRNRSEEEKAALSTANEEVSGHYSELMVECESWLQ